MSRLLIWAVFPIYFLCGVAYSEQFRFKPPVNLDPPINTQWDEFDPYVTADGQRFFFVREVGGNADIYMSAWNGSSWSNPVNLGPNVNSGIGELCPSVSPDGKKLYFTAYGRPGSLGGWDIWTSDWDSTMQQWGPAQNAGPVINSIYTEFTGQISPTGLSFYYATDGKGGSQGQALFVSRWNGSFWITPEILPYYINTTATEEYPTLTEDENTMYFVRWLTRYNGPAICVTEKDWSGVWSEPLTLDSVINGTFRSTGPYITPDGKRLYYGSGRPGGAGGFDIWMAERIILPTLGDLNSDGKITIADVMLELKKVFLNEPFPAESELGDSNCDSLFAPADVVLLLNRALLGRPFLCNI